LSENEDHQLSSIWLKAMIASDQGQEENRDKELERLVSHDATIDNVAEAQKEVGLLMVQLEKLRA
jgi:hypothetical protein